MKALVLAGGFATRLRPLSCTRPKILFPIVNKPLLQHTFERLAKHNIEEVIMAVNHQTKAAIKQHRIPKRDLTIRYSLDPPHKPLGSGGPIKKAEKLLGKNKSFLVLNGDIFADVNYEELLNQHDEQKAVATIALAEVKDPSRYGVAKLAKNRRIQKFVEKPPKKEAPSNLINAGAYLLSPKIFDYIPAGKTVSIERDVFTGLAEEAKLYGYVHRGLWMDIGKPEDYLEINRVMLQNHKTRSGHKVADHVKIRNPVAFDKGVRIGKDSTIGPNVVLGRNVRIAAHAHIHNSIILPRTTVSDSAIIENAIIGEGVRIGKGAKIGKGCILGDCVKVKDSVSLASNVLVCPAKEVAQSILKPQNIC